MCIRNVLYIRCMLADAFNFPSYEYQKHIQSTDNAIVFRWYQCKLIFELHSQYIIFLNWNISQSHWKSFNSAPINNFKKETVWTLKQNWLSPHTSADVFEMIESQSKQFYFVFQNFWLNHSLVLFTLSSAFQNSNQFRQLFNERAANITNA